MADGVGRVLVIKLGALGDFVQALGPFAAIRQQHKSAHLVLLTTVPFEELARQTGLFDEIWTDSRPRGLDFAAWFGLRKRLRDGRFERVYDLQTSDRSCFYYRLFWPGRRPQWSGIALGASHPHANPERDTMHTIERQAEQLAMAGVDVIPKPEEVLSGNGFVAPDAEFLAGLGITTPFALLAPGGAAHRPEKRWPAANFAALAQRLLSDGVQPVLLGTTAEAVVLSDIRTACPQACDVSGRTSLPDLVALARIARIAIGNDSGPMHLVAAAGCPSLVLFSGASDPALCGQRGRNVVILRQHLIQDIGMDDALAALETLYAR